MGPSPFEISRGISDQFSRARTKANDASAIQDILSQASQSGDPGALNNAIGKILSQVSPEKQSMAIQFLQNQYKMVKEQEAQQRTRQASARAGIDPDLPESIQKSQFEYGQQNKQIQDILNREKAQPSGGDKAPISQRAGSLDHLTDDQLVELAGIKGPQQEMYKQGLKKRQKDRAEDRADARERRKALEPQVNKIIEQANIARQSIRNKKRQIELVDQGNLNDPTIAAFLDSLPGNYGKRLMSDDTIEYKSGLVDEFKDLRNIFTGATRVKEIELLEDKIAGIYLTDSQKKAVLKARMNADKAYLATEQAAEEILKKDPNITPLEFNKRLNKRAQKKLDAIFDNVLSEHKSIIDQAQKRKAIPLNKDDPEDRRIMQEIKAEAGGNSDKALELAKKKGYIFK